MLGNVKEVKDDMRWYMQEAASSALVLAPADVMQLSDVRVSNGRVDLDTRDDQ